VTKPTTSIARAARPPNTPSPIGRTDSFWPGTTTAACCSAAFAVAGSAIEVELLGASDAGGAASGVGVLSGGGGSELGAGGSEGMEADVSVGTGGGTSVDSAGTLAASLDEDEEMIEERSAALTVPLPWLSAPMPV